MLAVITILLSFLFLVASNVVVVHFKLPGKMELLVCCTVGQMLPNQYVFDILFY